MSSLAGVDFDLGRCKKAESLYLSVLAADEKQLGTDHLSTLSTVNSLAYLYKIQGEIDEAQSLYEGALARQEKLIGPNHLDIRTTVTNLADVIPDAAANDNTVHQSIGLVWPLLDSWGMMRDVQSLCRFKHLFCIYG